PSQAIQTAQKGEYVFLIKKDLTVEIRPVVIARTMNGEAVVEKGLQPGDKVVTDGQLRLVPGAKVELKGSTEGFK
ncbi:MAG: efflux RND transporter periplasmic adaptor subunit, partial [Dehalococcoidia bacterium]|nr:efflux RND transporter periplasmic adaptor subunit [Dehalococcoidia bacterium]